jgi:hypothetical protein
VANIDDIQVKGIDFKVDAIPRLLEPQAELDIQFEHMLDPVPEIRLPSFREVEPTLLGYP